MEWNGIESTARATVETVGRCGRSVGRSVARSTASRADCRRRRRRARSTRHPPDVVTWRGTIYDMETRGAVVYVSRRVSVRVMWDVGTAVGG